MGALAQGDSASPLENAGRLEQIKQHAIEDLTRIPNYVCVDSIERSVRIPGGNHFIGLDRVHLELAHVDGADRFAWLGDSAFQSRTPTRMVGYGASFGGDFADNRAMVFKDSSTRISFAGTATSEGRPVLRYDYDHPQGGLRITNGNLSGSASARGSFWIDPETNELLQIDLEAYDIASQLALQSISDSARYQRVLIGERTMLLEHNSEFRITNADGTVQRNVSSFSNCREYRAESTLNFGHNPDPKGSEPAVKSANLRPNLQLQLVFDKTLDANHLAVGDPVRARVLKDSGEIRRGARVYGRVNRVINFNEQIPLPRPERSPRTAEYERWARHAREVLIQVEFFQIEDQRSLAPFHARLIDLESAPGKGDLNIRGFGYVDSDDLVKYDPPGTASIYVSRENPALTRDVIMQWVTSPE